jgi:hypothetical protein
MEKSKNKLLLTDIDPRRCEISKLNTRYTQEGTDGTIVELAEEKR